MSTQNLINDALDAAKRFIKWLLPSSKHLLDISLNVVNGIKTFDDKNPYVADFITMIIPGDADDAIKQEVRQYLPELLVRLKWADSVTPDDIVQDAGVFISRLPDAERAVVLQAIWQLLSNRLTDDGISIGDLQKIGQVYFQATTGK